MFTVLYTSLKTKAKLAWRVGLYLEEKYPPFLKIWNKHLIIRCTLHKTIHFKVQCSVQNIICVHCAEHYTVRLNVYIVKYSVKLSVRYILQGEGRGLLFQNNLYLSKNFFLNKYCALIFHQISETNSKVSKNFNNWSFATLFSLTSYIWLLFNQNRFHNKTKI